LISGLDLRVVNSNPMLGSTLGEEPTLKKKRIPWQNLRKAGREEKGWVGRQWEKVGWCMTSHRFC